MSNIYGTADGNPPVAGQFRLQSLTTDHMTGRVNATFTDNANATINFAIPAKSAKATPKESLQAACDACMKLVDAPAA